MNDEHAPLAPPARNEAVMADFEPLTPDLGAGERGQTAGRPNGPDAPGAGTAAQQWPRDTAEPRELGSRFPRYRGGRRRSPLWR